MTEIVALALADVDRHVAACVIVVAGVVVNVQVSPVAAGPLVCVVPPRLIPLLRSAPPTPVAVDGGGVARAVVGDAVGVDHDAGVGLGDGVVDGAAGVVVVAGHVRERPGVAVVRAGVRVRRAAEVQAALRSSPPTPVAVPVAVWAVAVVGDAVGRDRDRRVGLADVDRHVAALVIVVGVAERPVGGAAGPLVKLAPRLIPLLRSAPLTPVAVEGGACGRGIIGAAVAVDQDAGVGLGDGVVDGAAGVVVVAGDVRERPGVAVVRTGIRVRRAAEVQAGRGRRRRPRRWPCGLSCRM